MVVQAKEPISEAESSDAFYGPKSAAVLFVASDVDVMLKPLIQFLVPILNQISIRFSSLFSQLRFWRFFTPCKRFQPYRSIFHLVSSSSLGGFSSIESPVFLPRFLIEFKRFFHQLNTRFLPQSPSGFRRFSLLSHDLKRLYMFVGARVQEGRQL